MRDDTSVAVIIAAWRASARVGAAVRSALGEPETSEVMVVDDGSGDDGATLAAAQAADDGTGRLTCIALSANQGPANARNVAIGASRAPWIAILDSDDAFFPGRLAALLKEAETTRSEFIADDLLMIEDGASLSSGRSMLFAEGGEPLDVDFETFIRSNITRPGRGVTRELGYLHPIMSRAFLDRHGLVYDPDLRLGEDYDLYGRALAARCRFRVMPFAGYCYLRRRQSISANSTSADLLPNYLRIDERLLGLPGLTRPERRALRAHHDSTRRRMASINFNRAVKNRDVAKAAGVVMRDPLTAPWIVSGAGRAIVRNLRNADRQRAS
jgi:succinoglycan biosynthesis protein ExoU